MNILLATGSGNVGVNLSGIWESIKNAFCNFSVSDAFDIFFLALTFFFVFRFFRGKKGGAVLIGISVCIVVWFVSTTFNLDGLSFIFAKVFEIGAIALIVIFACFQLAAFVTSIIGSIVNAFRKHAPKRKRSTLLFVAYALLPLVTTAFYILVLMIV